LRVQDPGIQVPEAAAGRMEDEIERGGGEKGVSPFPGTFSFNVKGKHILVVGRIGRNRSNYLRQFNVLGKSRARPAPQIVEAH